MRNRVCTLLVNPHSGGGLETGLLEKMQAAMASNQGQTVVTKSVEEARQFVAQAPANGLTRLIVSGGDDSVRDILPALMETDCELGIVPRGTFNNLALALGLSTDPMQALALALTGEAKPMDLGRVAGHYFTESAGVGYLAEAWDRAPQPEPTGFLRWATGFLAASSALLDFQPLMLKISIDGVQTEEEIWDLTIANSSLFANNIVIAPKASLDDGLLDICLWPAISRLQFLGALPTVLSKDGPDQIPAIRTAQARVMKVTAPQEIPIRVDNAVAHGQEFCFEVLPGALQVVRP